MESYQAIGRAGIMPGYDRSPIWPHVGIMPGLDRSPIGPQARIMPGYRGMIGVPYGHTSG